ncbi:Protein kinase domain containing protein [Reticulomyxa filosa]|uniref:Casein kinase I n=1 Tax=Reticulomyxa filosa TaxID=46433 RepID=X6NDE3_RETFI|nr:Protein kinase domain containing protein [Reticulomyxa filosa]|eukprot:ETO23888.1 Protein kinase domain containing protein [Reticulomyxa filosa]
MDKLGESLEQLFTLCGRKFSIKCVCLIALQLISRIQELHNHGWLHRDVKPDNFLIGDGPKSGTAGSQIYMIDFGLGKRWIENSSHISFKTEKRLIGLLKTNKKKGTPRYASINTHSGYEQSRRDDLESLGYMLVYFVRGSLPWQGLKGDKEKKYQKIGDIKKKTELNKLCKGFPDEFRQYLASCRELAFTAQPAYDEYKQYFKNVLKHLGYDPDNPQDNVFDWQDETKLHVLGGMTLPNLNGLVANGVNGVSVTLHTANHANTNHNGSSHMLLQQIQSMDNKNNNHTVHNNNRTNIKI